jgi:hypothetical protein
MNRICNNGLGLIVFNARYFNETYSRFIRSAHSSNRFVSLSYPRQLAFIRR